MYVFTSRILWHGHVYWFYSFVNQTEKGRNSSYLLDAKLQCLGRFGKLWQYIDDLKLINSWSHETVQHCVKKSTEIHKQEQDSNFTFPKSLTSNRSAGSNKSLGLMPKCWVHLAKNILIFLRHKNCNGRLYNKEPDYDNPDLSVSFNSSPDLVAVFGWTPLGQLLRVINGSAGDTATHRHVESEQAQTHPKMQVSQCGLLQ